MEWSASLAYVPAPSSALFQYPLLKHGCLLSRVPFLSFTSTCLTWTSQWPPCSLDHQGDRSKHTFALIFLLNLTHVSNCWLHILDILQAPPTQSVHTRTYLSPFPNCLVFLCFFSLLANGNTTSPNTQTGIGLRNCHGPPSSPTAPQESLFLFGFTDISQIHPVPSTLAQAFTHSHLAIAAASCCPPRLNPPPPILLPKLYF